MPQHKKQCCGLKKRAARASSACFVASLNVIPSKYLRPAFAFQANGLSSQPEWAISKYVLASFANTCYHCSMVVLPTAAGMGLCLTQDDHDQLVAALELCSIWNPADTGGLQLPGNRNWRADVRRHGYVKAHDPEAPNREKEAQRARMRRLRAERAA